MSDTSEVKADDTIKRFLYQFDMVVKIDTSGSFDYFTYLINWIKGNCDGRDFQVNYEYLQKNKTVVGLSVIEVIFDYIMKSQFELVSDVLGAQVRGLDDDVTFTSRQKERFTKAILQAFYKYLDEVDQSVQEFIDTAIDSLATRNDEKMNRVNNDDYDRLIDVLKSS